MENTFIKAASSIVIHDAMAQLKKLAVKHDKLSDVEYLHNMLLMSVVGYAISTGRDKLYLVEMFTELIKEQQEENAEELIKKAKELL
jgi:Na+/H+ antiporter NhaD/arsenite permease-like protein